MNTRSRFSAAPIKSGVLLIALALALPNARAQDTSGSTASPDSPMHDMSGMDHAGMPGLSMPSDHNAMKPRSKKPGKKSPAPAPVEAKDAKTSDDMWGRDRSSMPGMQHAAAPNDPGTMERMDHGAMRVEKSADAQTMEALSATMTGPMQGGRAPANARSPDYSDGVGYGSMVGMDMLDSAPFGMLLVDQLEAFDGGDATGQRWDAEGWYGNDRDKVWMRTEGERSHGAVENADLEVFWNRNVATFWSTQLGVRHDSGEGPSRSWAAFGVQGLAPYWFELEATGYVGGNGRTAARLRAEYELLLTQRLVLQPELELNLYGKDDPARRIGSGFSDAQFALRLRYEVTRQFAPYVGVSWIRPFGTTADYAREDHRPLLDRQIVAGIRFWF